MYIAHYTGWSYTDIENIPADEIPKIIKMIEKLEATERAYGFSVVDYQLLLSAQPTKKTNKGVESDKAQAKKFQKNAQKIRQTFTGENFKNSNNNQDVFNRFGVKVIKSLTPEEFAKL